MQSNLDLIIESNILTMANQQPRVQAVGVKNGKIAAVGSLDELTKAKGNDTLVLDLKGKTVLPGFIDSHMHPVLTGMVHAGVDLSAVHTIDDTLVKIKERVEKTDPGVWVQCFRFQDKLLQEKRFPTKQELDDISTAHPIIIFHNDLHFAMMNTPAMQQIDFPAELEGVQTYEALRLFTINNAKIGFEEDIKGSIEKGKLADFVVLSRDPYQVRHDEIGNITVEMTILGGNIVYQNKT